MTTLHRPAALVQTGAPNYFAEWLDTQILAFRPQRTSARAQWLAAKLEDILGTIRYLDARTPEEFEERLLELERDRNEAICAEASGRGALKSLCIAPVPAGPDDDAPLEF